LEESINLWSGNLGGAINNVEQNLNGLTKVATESHQQINEMKTSFNALVQSQTLARTQIMDRLEQIKQQLDAIPTKMDEHKKGMEDVSKNVENLFVQIEKTAHNLENSTKTCVTSLEEAVKITETNNSERHKAIVDQQANIHRDIQTIQRVCQAVDHKMEQVATKETTLANGQLIIDKISQMSTTITQNLADATKETNTLIDNHKNASAEFEKSISPYIEKIYMLTDENKKTLKELKTGLDGTKANLLEGIKDTQAILDQLTQDLNERKKGGDGTKEETTTNETQNTTETTTNTTEQQQNTAQQQQNEQQNTEEEEQQP